MKIKNMKNRKKTTRKADPGNLLSLVCGAIDQLIESAQAFNGLLFPSVLEIKSGKVPKDLPPAIPGQRDCDRAFPCGSNLTHDHSVLRLMYDLAGSTGETCYRDAADGYLRHWSLHCTTTPTGLFPWGEHAFWNLEEDRPGSSYALARVYTMPTHDHLIQAPAWLWEKLWEFNYREVERFCLALENHFLDVENPLQYNRHANLLRRHPMRKRHEGHCDFPRHSGFHIYDWSFAYAKTGSPTYRRLLVRSLDYWWERKYECGLLATDTATISRRLAAPCQTLSLCATLYEAAALIAPKDPDLAKVVTSRAATYCKGLTDLLDNSPKGELPHQINVDTKVATLGTPVWEGAYGLRDVAGEALLSLCIHRINKDPRLLEFAKDVARLYAKTAFPTDKNIPIVVCGCLLLLLTDLFSLTGDEEWLDMAEAQAGKLAPLYMNDGLPRGATGIEIYESQLLPGYFLRGLARIAFLRKGRDIGADYTRR
ncbi:MAG: hypothetical protein A2X48_17010 [Lentisphaerae bacterium GWF2_49_21]|nr:MAG: hypothetical protein A2X48_17010 [Lentisphaerae bacterium GWF2_49_21]